MEKVLEMKQANDFCVSHGTLLRPEVLRSLTQVCAVDMNVRAAWSFARMLRKIEKLSKTARESLNELIVDKYFLKDENGHLVPIKTEEGNLVQGAYKLKEEGLEFKAEFEKAEKDFMDITLPTNLTKLSLDSLTDRNGQMIEVKGSILAALEEFFEEE